MDLTGNGDAGLLVRLKVKGHALSANEPHCSVTVTTPRPLGTAHYNEHAQPEAYTTLHVTSPGAREDACVGVKSGVCMLNSQVLS